MFQLQWRNLRTNNCPYCNGDLKVKEIDGVQELKCESCYFHIPTARAKSIVENRRPRQEPIVRIKWQMLRIERCPICSDMLMKKEGEYAILKCVSHLCTFHIREDILQKYLSDPAHPVNRYPLDENEESQRFLQSLE